METMPDWGWLLFAYTIGTIIGWMWGYKQGALAASEHAIDSLIEQGVIRTSTDDNGEIQIHKWNDKE